MKLLRRLSVAVLSVSVLHLVFGGVVRITGSGMGCGDHWPKCFGRWFPPMDRPDLIIEISHRYLASILLLAVLGLLVTAWRKRAEPGVGGTHGIVRPAAGATVTVIAAALLGGVTVKLGTAPMATVGHWALAAVLLAFVVAAAIRTGALGGDAARRQGGSVRAARGATAAMVLAMLVLVMGGLTAKFPGAAVGCQSFPHCGPNPAVSAGAAHIQLTHRTLAFLVGLHLVGMVMMLHKRRETEAPVVRRAAGVALGLVLLQITLAAGMIHMALPMPFRLAHQALGVGIWLTIVAFALLAWRASRGGAGAGASQGVRAGAGAPGAVEPAAGVTASTTAALPPTMAVFVARGGGADL